MLAAMRAPLTALLVLTAVVARSGAPAEAKPKPKPKYHFVLADVTLAKGVEGDAATFALPRIKAQVEKAFASHPQLVAVLEGAPDPRTDPKGFTAYLKRKKIAGAHRVSVEVTAAMEETEEMEAKSGQRLVVRLGVRMFSETIPVRTMGFTGEGSATIKQEVGKKVRPRDREYSWDQAAELAINDAIEVCLAKLAIPPPAPSKK
jgi:hypothetical protein